MLLNSQISLGINNLTIHHISIIIIIIIIMMMPHHSHSAHLGPCAEGLLGSGLVGGFALPGGEGRGLECATEGEGQLPGAVEGHLVDGVQVEGSFLLALASRQEADAWEEPGHAVNLVCPCNDFYRLLCW